MNSNPFEKEQGEESVDHDEIKPDKDNDDIKQNNEDAKNDFQATKLTKERLSDTPSFTPIKIDQFTPKSELTPKQSTNAELGQFVKQSLDGFILKQNDEIKLDLVDPIIESNEPQQQQQNEDGDGDTIDTMDTFQRQESLKLIDLSEESDNTADEALNRRISDMREDTIVDLPIFGFFELLAHLENFKTRNRLFCALLMYWSALHFIVHVRYNSSGNGFWSAAAFMTFVACVMTIFNLSIELNETFYLATIGMLALSGVLLFIAAIVYVIHECDDDSCGVLWFGHLLIPLFVIVMLAFDLWTEHFEHPMVRLYSFCSILMVSGILCMASYLDRDQDELSGAEKVTEFGYVLLTVVTFTILTLYAGLREAKNALFNAFMSSLMMVAFILLLTSDLIVYSTYVAWFLMAVLMKFMVFKDLRSVDDAIVTMEKIRSEPISEMR